MGVRIKPYKPENNWKNKIVGSLEIFEKFCLETSIGGLNHYGQRHYKIWKIIWVILSVAGLVSAAFGCVGVYNRWRANPTSTDVKILTKNSMLLPQFAVCTNNILSPALINRHNMSKNLQKMFRKYTSVKTNPLTHPILGIDADSAVENSFNLPDETWTATKYEYETLVKKANIKDFNEFMNKMILKCSDFVLACTLNAGPFDCCSSPVVDVYEGALCVGLTSGDQTQAGVGMTILLNNSVLRSTDFRFPVKAIPATVVLNAETLNDQFIRFYAPVGKETAITLNHFVINAVDNPPRLHCNDDPNFNRFHCLSACTKQSATIPSNACRCVNPLFSNDWTNDVLCDPWEFRNCPEAEFDVRKYFECINTNCTLPCHQNRLSQAVQSMEFDYNVLAEGFGVSVEKAAAVAANIISVSISYTSLEKYVIDQQFSMSFSSALSEIGGQFGLFVGASLLTFIHVIIFCCELAFRSAVSKNECSKIEAIRRSQIKS